MFVATAIISNDNLIVQAFNVFALFGKLAHQFHTIGVVTRNEYAKRFLHPIMRVYSLSFKYFAVMLRLHPIIASGVP